MKGGGGGKVTNPIIAIEIEMEKKSVLSRSAEFIQVTSCATASNPAMDARGRTGAQPAGGTKRGAPSTPPTTPRSAPEALGIAAAAPSPSQEAVWCFPPGEARWR